MAKRSILVSDFSGEEVDETNGGTIRATFGNSEKVLVADATAEEIMALLSVKGTLVAREQSKRGRKAGSGEESEPEATK
jgi:hypothetical protein